MPNHLSLGLPAVATRRTSTLAAVVVEIAVMGRHDMPSAVYRANEIHLAAGDTIEFIAEYGRPPVARVQAYGQVEVRYAAPRPPRSLTPGGTNE